MPWYWILIIISAIVGPFEAMHALNKARKNREAAERRQSVGNHPQQSSKDETGNVHIGSLYGSASAHDCPAGGQGERKTD